MKKLRLELDALRVESFETAIAREPRGTVHGRGWTDVVVYCRTDRPVGECYPTNYDLAFGTDDSGDCSISCNATCAASCNGTCDGSCNGTCAASWCGGCGGGSEFATDCCGSQYASACGGQQCH